MIGECVAAALALGLAVVSWPNAFGVAVALAAAVLTSALAVYFWKSTE